MVAPVVAEADEGGDRQPCSVRRTARRGPVAFHLTMRFRPNSAWRDTTGGQSLETKSRVAQLVVHHVQGVEAPGSSPGTPTTITPVCGSSPRSSTSRNFPTPTCGILLRDLSGRWLALRRRFFSVQPPTCQVWPSGKLEVGRGDGGGSLSQKGVC